MNDDIFNYIMSLVIDNANDVVSDVEKDPDNIFKKGRQMAYYEVLDTIRNALIVYDYDLKECGLEDDPMLRMHHAAENQ